MNADDILQRHAFALELAREGGALALDYFHRRAALTVRSKGLQDVVSEADLETELLIHRRIAGRFPEDAFLGEETGRARAAPGQGLWVVDPIDGTQPFVNGLTCWCVSIAFVVDLQVQFGVVFAPARDELFTGGLQVPATLNGQPVTGHPGHSLADGLTSVGYSTRLGADDFLPMFTRFLHAGGMFHREGSGALGLCYVACGRLLGYLERHMNSWDCLGAFAVLHAAGLQTNDFLSGDGLHQGNRVIAGNAAIHSALEALYDPLPLSD